MLGMISIIVPVYNATLYLNQCIQSIVEQTYAEIEIILVDDGSSDNSAEICKKWCFKDDRIKFIAKTNGGVSSARNVGIDAATGDFISFVDSDDYIASNYCEKLISHIKDDIDLVVLGLKSFNSNAKIGTVIKHRMPFGIYQVEELKKYIIDDGTMSGFTIHSPCAVLYRKAFIENFDVRFRTNIKYNEDGLFNTEYILKCSNQIYVNYEEVVYYYRVNEASATHNVDILGEKYQDSMNNIETVLQDYATLYPQYTIINQLHARHITNAVSSILYIVANGKDKKLISQIIRNDHFSIDMKYLNYQKMSTSKRILYQVLKTKNIWLIWASVSYYLSKRRKEQNNVEN